VAARLSSAVLADSIMRRVSGAGGFATLIAKGDETAGVILLIGRDQGRLSGVWERQLNRADHYEWVAGGPQYIENESEVDAYIVRRRTSDPDLWAIELDIPDAAQFIAELTD
jgi:hypothetical protein